MTKDPLILAPQPDGGRELFRKFSAAANGHSYEQAVSAAANIIINAIRQSAPTWPKAEQEFNEYFGRMKQVLKDHYDTMGRKRGIFPYDQVIHVPHFDLSRKQ